MEKNIVNLEDVKFVIADGVPIVNLTPHEVTVFERTGKEKILSIPPSGWVARVEQRRNEVGEIAGIPVVKVSQGKTIVVKDNERRDIEGIADDIREHMAGTDDYRDWEFSHIPIVVIVSSMVAEKTVSTDNITVLAPDTGAGSVRDEKGRIVGTTGFVIYF